MHASGAKDNLNVLQRVIVQFGPSRFLCFISASLVLIVCADFATHVTLGEVRSIENICGNMEQV